MVVVVMQVGEKKLSHFLSIYLREEGWSDAWSGTG